MLSSLHPRLVLSVRRFCPVVRGFLICFTVLSLSMSASADVDQWTWMGGPNAVRQAGVYGERGVSDPANQPGSRSNPLHWTDNEGNFWLFGGTGFNDLWKYELETGLWTWMHGSDNTTTPTAIYGTQGISDPQNQPGPRYGAAGWVDAMGNLWLFGGQHVTSENYNDLWKYDVALNQWVWMKGSANANKFGNYGSKGIVQNSNCPGSRMFSNTWTDTHGKFWLYGGNGRSRNSSGMLDDLWTYDPAINIWIWVNGSDAVNQQSNFGILKVPHDHNHPGGRCMAQSWADGDGSFWLFGGFQNSTSFANDLWKYDINSNKWTWMHGTSATNQYGKYGTQKVSSPSNRPGGRYRSLGWTDVSGNLWMFGGTGYGQPNTFGFLDDLWKYDVGREEWVWIAGTGFKDQSTQYGSPGIPSQFNSPGGRTHLAGWRGKNGDLWLFGGFGKVESTWGPLNDLWRFDTPNLSLTNKDSSNGVATRGSEITYNIEYGHLTDQPSDVLDLIIETQLPTNITFTTATIATGPTASIQHSSGVVTLTLDEELTAGQKGKFVVKGLIDSQYTGISTNTATAYYRTSLLSPATSISATALTRVNNPPISQDDIYDTPVNTMLQVSSANGLTVNDFDTDPMDKLVTITVTAPPSNGSLIILSSAGDFKYTPNPGFYGVETFTYEISDGYEPSDTARVSIFVDQSLPGQWAWMGGSNDPGQYGTYGTLRVPDPANQAGARSEATFWKDHHGDFWLFGGRGSATTNTGELNDLWKFNPDDEMWTWMHGDSSASGWGHYGTKGQHHDANIPRARYGTASWTTPDGSLWLFGGVSALGEHNDLWKYDTTLNQWTWMHGPSLANGIGVYGTRRTGHSENVPGARYGSTSWTDNEGNLWLFGGRGRDSADPGYYSRGPLNDVWKYDMVQKHWIWIDGSPVMRQPGAYGTIGIAHDTNQPGSRYHASSWRHGSGNLWVFGGSGYGEARTGYLNDLWYYNISTEQWTWLGGSSTPNQPGQFGIMGEPSPDTGPGGRYGSLPWNDDDSHLYMLGGAGVNADGTGVLNDMWRYDVQAGTWSFIEGSRHASQYGIYSQNNMPYDSSGPGGRYHGASWIDDSRRLWFFGGSGFGATRIGAHNDLWMYVLNPGTSSIGNWSLY